MSKPVFKKLSEDIAAQADLLMGQANACAELAKIELPFPLNAALTRPRDEVKPR